MQSQAAREHKPGASRLLPPPPPPLPPPALRTRDCSCTTLTARFPPCPEKCDRSPREFPRQVWRPERGVNVCAYTRGVGARAAGLLRNLVNFPGPFPRDSDGSPRDGAGAGTWTGASYIFATVPPGTGALRTRCAASLKLSVLSFPSSVLFGGGARGRNQTRELDK